MENVPRETSSAASLSRALRQLCPDLRDEVVEVLAGHFALMLTWNRTHNLTRIVDPHKAASAHYLDSLLPLLELPEPRHVADLGSGNGLPGLAAAALWPSARVSLVEAHAKKCSFLRTCRSSLGLPGVEVLNQRVEQLPPLGADLVLSRATFPWQELPPMAARHLGPGALLVGYLGREAPSPEQWSMQACAAGLVHPTLRHHELPPDASQRHLACARAQD